MRSFMDEEGVNWRFGAPPDYTLANLMSHGTALWCFVGMWVRTVRGGSKASGETLVRDGVSDADPGVITMGFLILVSLLSRN